MRGNRMGPEEQGPKTGRGLGFCNGYEQPGFMNGAESMRIGRGFSQWGGRGRGFRRYWNPAPRDESGVFSTDVQNEILDRLEKLEKTILDLTDTKEA